MTKILAAVGMVMLLCISAAHAQSASDVSSTPNPNAATDAGPAAGGNEMEFWTGGGPSVHGGEEGLGVWIVGFRYGWVITGLHGPSILRGHAEYAMDVEPVFVVLQPGHNAYGINLVPMVLKWDFAPHRGVVPYFNLDGGLLLTDRATPPNASRINFTPAGAIGAHFLLHKYNVSAELRLLHASDASLTAYNPGMNTVEVRMGFGIFTHPK